MKHDDCAEVGIHSVGEHLPADAQPGRARGRLARFNADPASAPTWSSCRCPPGLDEERALLAVDPDKDVDGLHPVNLGPPGDGARQGPLPCTPAGIVELLHAYDVPVEGSHVVIIGRGLTIGRPAGPSAGTLKRPGCNAAVTVVHTGVDDLAAIARMADVVVAAAGRAGLVHRRHGQARRSGGGGRHHVGGKKLLPDVDDRRGRGGRAGSRPASAGWGP